MSLHLHLSSRCNTFVEEVCNSRFLCTSTKSPFLGTGPKLTLLLHSDGVLNLIFRAKKQIKRYSPGKRKRVVICCKQFFSLPVLYGVRENYSLPKLTHAYDALTSYIRREGHLFRRIVSFIREVCVSFNTRLTFPRLTGPTDVPFLKVYHFASQWIGDLVKKTNGIYSH